MSRLSKKQVYIRSRRPHHPALGCDTYTGRGRVFADQFENATEEECWTLEHRGNDTYSIEHQGWYLKADRDGNVRCEKTYCWDPWKIESTRKGYVSIKSCFGKYLCCDEDFRVTADREHCELWEQWAIVDMPHLLVTPTREVYIRSCQQQLFCNKDDGLPALSFSSVKANRYGPATDDERWRVMCIDVDKVLLTSNIGYLTCDRDGKVETIQTNPYPYTEIEGLSWNIEIVESTFRNAVALKSEFGGYLCCSNDDHFMCDGSLKADSTGCCDRRTWWVFLTNAQDTHGNMALEKEAITMKNYNIEYA